VTAAPPAERTSADTRSRAGRLDALTAVALLVVVAAYSFGSAWLPLTVPALGLVFAAEGHRAAAAVDATGSLRGYLRQRLPRVLLPYWLFAAVVLPLMLAPGWRVTPGSSSAPLDWSTAWRWLLPLVPPPASARGVEWTGALDLVALLLWFVLLAPAALWLFRRWPLRLAAVPVVVLAVLGIGLMGLADDGGEVLIGLCVFAPCWLLGFAVHDGRLRQWPAWRSVAAGLLLVGVALGYALPRRARYAELTAETLPFASMLLAAGAVLLLLCLRSPVRLAPLRPVPALRAATAFVGSRAVTTLLWANLAIAATSPVLAASPLASFHTPDAGGMWLQYAAACVLLLVVWAGPGWLEAPPQRSLRRPHWSGRRRFVLVGNFAAGDGPAGAR
jgi:hypothetical protein